MGVGCLLHSSGQEAENASYPPENTKTHIFPLASQTQYLETSPPPTRGCEFTGRLREVFVPEAKQSQWQVPGDWTQALQVGRPFPS